MAWVTLADATSLEELQAAKPAIADLPAGTPVKLRIELPAWAPVGKLADLAGAEWWASRFIGADVEVIDVYGDWYWMEVTGRARGTPVLLLITIIIAALSALGIAWFISRIMLDADIPSLAKIGLGLGLLVIGIVLVSGRKQIGSKVQR